LQRPKGLHSHRGDTEALSATVKISEPAQQTGSCQLIGMDCHVSKIPQLLPADADAVFVITGANRGIGLEQVRQFIEKTKVHVVCTVRKSSKIDHLQSFARQGHSKQFSIVEMDTSDEASIQVCYRKLAPQTAAAE